jgi:hypothetical protein
VREAVIPFYIFLLRCKSYREKGYSNWYCPAGRVYITDIYRLDGGVEGSGMGLFLIRGHWLKILPQNSKGAS